VEKWLLSGHNPRETFGISYPISVSYSENFASGRQLEKFIKRITGNDDLDASMPPMLTVQGSFYINISYFVRNLAPVLPFEAESFGAPSHLVPLGKKPPLWRMVPVLFRFLAVYHEIDHLYGANPQYRQILEEVYWPLQECDPDRLTKTDLSLIWPLFDQSLIDRADRFIWAHIVNTFVSVAVGTEIRKWAPDLLNAFVGRGTTTAALGERMLELRTIATQCGDEVLSLLRVGEGNLDKYRALTEAEPFVEAVERFLRIYGHRAFSHASEFEAKRLVDEVDVLLVAVAGLIGEGGVPSAQAEIAPRIESEVLQKMNQPGRLVWKQVLNWSAKLLARREEGRDLAELQNATYGLAARLLSRHYFPDQPDDYLWLYTFDEFIAFGQSRGQQRVAEEEVEKRRAELQGNRQMALPPELIWYDPKARTWWPALEEGEVRAAQVRLKGIGAGAGRGPVEGVALVTDDAQQAAKRLLEISGPVILVTPVTDPVWSSLFLRLAAVVTEMGGILSHAAIVAREYGIPVVVSLPEATRRIQDGQRIRVDGAAGLVEVIES
jgi:phosphohistidine swiveling domain-containing protein